MSNPKGKSAKPPTNGSVHHAKGEPTPRAAYFLSLSLENVRCFGPKQTLDLSDGHGKPAPWTIILGLNGTGKTTILQSLTWFEQGMIPGPEQNGWAPRFLRLSFDMELADSFCRGGRQIAAVWGCRVVEAEGLLDAPGTLLDGRCQIFASGPTLTYSHNRTRLWCVAYGAGRRVGIASLSDSVHDDPTATLFDDRAELRNPEEWLLQLDYAAAKATKHDKEPQERLAKAKELLLNILPDVEDIRLATTSGPSPKPRAEFKTPYGWVQLRQLGYGYQTLITWVADLANRMAERYPDSPNPLAEPAVVLVDEIDLHLHPKWQRKLMSFLTERFPNTQFIATAHSPLVAQAAAEANLAVLRREGDHVIIDNEVDNIRNWRIDQILTSDLFGLETARPPQIEAFIVERRELLEKSRLTAADKRRVKELEDLIGELPFGETEQERKDRDEIKTTLELLMKERKPAS